MVFDEESVLQDKSEMKDKAQGGVSDNSADTQKKKSWVLKEPLGQMRILQIQMEKNRRLLNSNIDR